MSKFGSIVASVIAAAGVVSGSVMLASPAAAAPTKPCPAGFYCFYNNANYQGQWSLNYNSTASGTFNNPPSSNVGDVRNQLSSIINNGDRTICIYDDRTAQRDDLIAKVTPFQDVPNLASTPGRNDKADYWKLNAC